MREVELSLDLESELPLDGRFGECSYTHSVSLPRSTLGQEASLGRGGQLREQLPIGQDCVAEQLVL